MDKLRTIKDLGDLSGKKVLLRADLNVPVHEGRIIDLTRVRSIKKTVMHLLKAGANVILLSHFDRPGGKVVPEMSLAPLAPCLEDELDVPVTFAGDALDAKTAKIIAEGEGVFLVENLRFHPGEEKNQAAFAKKLAALGDVYINDAFSSAHRAHASIEGITRYLPSAAGFALVEEIEALRKAFENPERPVAAVIGGAKISAKIATLENLVSKMDHLFLGGAMANTFLAAKGENIGASVFEPNLIEVAKKIMEKAEKAGCCVHLPAEVTVAKQMGETVGAIALPLDAIEDDDMIFDIGPRAADNFIKVLKRCKTVLWNGPLGAFEIRPFDHSTTQVARAVGNLTKKGKMISIAGGGDTVAALYNAEAKWKFSYVSTAGGAFLEWLEGKTLPGIKALMSQG
jgi:phosphoglycerate kinase